MNQTEVPTVETHSSLHWNLPSDSRHEHPLKTKLLDKASGLGSVHMPSPVMSSLLSSRAHRTWNMANLDIVAHHGPVFRIVALMQLGFSCFREGSPISLMVLHRLGFPSRSAKRAQAWAASFSTNESPQAIAGANHAPCLIYFNLPTL